MSFSGNSLAHGARLDYNSFMNNKHTRPQSPEEDSTSTSPLRRGVVPLSYAYGAPTLGKGTGVQTSPNRLPSPTRSSSSSIRNRSTRSAATGAAENEDEIDSNISYASSSARAQEPGAVRYARLKQRNQALGATSYHSSGPGIILSPPNGTNLRDTSVNVATAFTQAAQNSLPIHDYEKETHTSSTTTNRRIAAPPSKVRKPNSGTATHLAPPDEAVGGSARARSPILETMANAGQVLARAVSPTRYFLRETEPSEEQRFHPLRIDDPPAKPLSRQGTKNSTVPSNDSYDYEAEENFMRGEGSLSGETSRHVGHQKKKSVTLSASARLSMDNKAYKPPSDEEEEDDYEDDGLRRRRKGKKKDEGKSLSTLPTIGYDKRRKRKSISKRSEVTIDEDDGVSAGEQVASSTEDRKSGSRPPSRATSRAGSVSRDSVPPSHPAHFQPLEPPLDEVAETDQEVSDSHQDISVDNDIPRHPPRARSKDHYTTSYMSKKSRSTTPRTTQSDVDMRRMEAQTHGGSGFHRFSLGGFLGRIVHFILVSILRRFIQFVVMVFFLVWTVIGGIFTVLVATPLYWIEATTRSARRDLPWINVGKVIFFALVIAVAAAALYPSSVARSPVGYTLLRWISGRNVDSYHAPDIPAKSVEDLISRLTHVENALADLALKEQQARQVHSAEQRIHDEVASRVELLHGRIEAEAQRALEAEEQFRAAAAKGLLNIRNEFEAIQTEWEQTRGEGPTGNFPVEDLQELRERIGTVEVGVKEALELGKTSTKAGNSVGWWNKWNSAGENKLTIKSSDGHDVTALIGSLVDHAISRFSRDGLGKPDFALYSAGGRVIPQLTTNTYEVKPDTWVRYVIGAVTGSGYAMGRPPVTAIHPDINVGNCWPFAGTRGQIGLLLARNVFISEFSIDHAPQDIAYDVRSAPRQMEVWGLVQGADNIAKVREYQQAMRARRAEVVRQAEEQGIAPPPEEDPYPNTLPRSPHHIRLARFSYDIHSPEHVQTFSVPKEIQDIGADFGVVVLFINDNWGQEDFTCLYRFRVHGTEKDGRPYVVPDSDGP